jgi:hypothetical protein
MHTAAYRFLAASLPLPYRLPLTADPLPTIMAVAGEQHEHPRAHRRVHHLHAGHALPRQPLTLTYTKDQH